MDDARVWSCEESLWIGDAELYQTGVDDQCLMVLPAPPFVFTGQQAKEAVNNTPRWQKVEFLDQQVSRPQEGLIVIAYGVRASHEERGTYHAYCTSTYRRLGHEDWQVVSHQQTVPLTSNG